MVRVLFVVALLLLDLLIATAHLVDIELLILPREVFLVVIEVFLVTRANVFLIVVFVSLNIDEARCCLFRCLLRFMVSALAARLSLPPLLAFNFFGVFRFFCK